jgi:hypothetical protein
MTDISPAAIDALVYQLGHAHPDDIDYNAAADTITALRARVAELDGEYARGVNDAADLIHKIAKGYDDGGDKAIACGLYLTEGNIRALLPAGKGVV